MIVGICEIHGIGTRLEPGYSKRRHKLLVKYSKNTIIHTEVHWWPSNEQDAQSVIDSRYDCPPKWKWKKRAAYLSRSLMLRYLSDITAYENLMKHEIQSKVIERLKYLESKCDKIILIGHSLGSLIAHDVAIDSPVKIDGLVTTGCPIPIIRYEAIRNPGCKWLNIWEYSDFISMKMSRDYCKDYEYKSKRFLGWTVVAHKHYMKSKSLARLIVSEMGV